jgi:hypothetical protein
LGTTNDCVGMALKVELVPLQVRQLSSV